MTNASAASRRYAHALLEAAASEGPAKVESVAKELSEFSRTVDSSFDVKNVLLNPIFTAEDRDGVLRTLMERLQLSTTVSRFLQLLVERERISDLADITATFRTMADQRAGRLCAEVRAASELSSEAMERLRKALEKRTGKSIELSVSVDPDLLGGVSARVGSIVFDGTLRSELNRLRETLTQGD